MDSSINNFQELLRKIQSLQKDDTIIIAISGFCGAGKSTLTSRLQKELRDAAHIPGDAFMVDRLNRRTDDWETIDQKRIIEQVLEPAQKHQPIRYQVYNWDKNTAEEWREVPHPKYLLLEGIGTIHPDILPYLDFSVWVEKSQDDAAAQGIRRDHEERGHNHDDLWHEFLIPNDQAYFKKHQPHQKADFVYTP